MKKFLSASLVFALILTLSSPAFAVDNHMENYDDSVTISLNGKPINIQYHIEDKLITYAEIGNDIMSVKGNVVFINNVKVATITSTTVDSSSNAVVLRTSWIYSDTCPSGASPSDYNTLFTTKSHNVTFEQTIVKYSEGAILAVLIAIFPFGREVAARDVFQGIAYMIAGLAVGDLSFGNSHNVYSTEYIYSGPIPYTRKNNLIFYSNSAKTKEIDRTTCYSSWA